MPIFLKHPKSSVWIATATTAIAGTLHLFPSALSHLTPYPPLETAFFVLLGVTQLIWAYEFNRKDTEKKYQFGLALNGGAAMLWILTRTLVAPFSAGPEHIGILDTTVLILEVISIIGLMSWHHAIKQKIANVITGALIITLISGFSFYGGARSLELVFPDRESAHGHGNEADEPIDDDIHDEDGNHIEEMDEMRGDKGVSMGMPAGDSPVEEMVVEKEKKNDDHNNDDGHHD